VGFFESGASIDMQNDINVASVRHECAEIVITCRDRDRGAVA
jgi:hypothetical protein